MTDIDKIKAYYGTFDEWQRLEEPEGKMEFEITIDIIRSHLSAGSSVLDLGGGPGRYTAALSGEGYRMSLADLSAELIAIAHKRIPKYGNPENVSSIRVCNALDLSIYSNDSFDAVLLLGPLYHLTTADEIRRCLSETARVTKQGGKIFAAYIPWISGLNGVTERSFRDPGQVGSENLLKTFKDGIFNNASTTGFQEGSYLRTNELLGYFSEAGFRQVLLRSIRGLGHQKAGYIYGLKKTDPEYYSTIMQVIHDTATESSVIETCGHALFVGEKE